MFAMINNEARLIAIGRYVHGVNVLGYMIKDIENNTSQLLPRSEVEDLAIHKKICNVTAQIYDGKVLIKGINCKLSSLPVYDDKGKLIDTKYKKEGLQEGLIVISRILKGKFTVGYTLALLTNGIKCGEKRLSKSDVIKLAEKGKIINLRVQKYNGKHVLRGVNCELAKLPSVQLNKS